MPLIDNDSNTINSIPLTEQGSTPATPATGKWRVYFKSDGIYILDDAGTETGPLGASTGGGQSEDYIHIREEQAYNADGGTFTLGDWRTRVLNTEVSDAGNHASLASNQITLAAGTYRAHIICPVYGVVTSHVARLYNTTDSAVLLLSGSEYSGTSTSGHALIVGRFTIAASKVLEVQHQSTGTVATNGFGSASYISGVASVYTQVELWKEL
jgi:hypothetical protein